VTFATKEKSKKAERKITAAPNVAYIKPKKVATTGAKSVTAAPPVAKPHPTTSPLEGISDFVDNLPSRHVSS
jgi:hypothetical protein